jgi:16S rRNA processing protein RimM
MDIGDCFKIGYVSKTHGLKGGVTVVLNPASPGLDEFKLLYIEINGGLVPYTIEHYSDRSDKAFIKLEDVNTPELAQQLRGCSLFIPKTERPKSTRGDFYDDEVVGFGVEDVSLGELGKVREILQLGPNRLLAVNGHLKEILIPINGPFILSVNKSKKKFTVDLPEGFLDI